MRVTYSFITIVLVCSLLVGGSATRAMAQSPVEFFKGKTITCVSEFAEDAAMTVLSRILAPFIEKYTGANVLVKPMPGGGGTLARNYLYAAKPDGLTIILVGHGPKLITGGLFKLQGVRYEWEKFTPIGKAIAAISCVIIDKNWPGKNPQDMAGERFNYGESSPFYGPLFAEAFGWGKMTVIPGYRSTTERAVAISRGELQAATADASTIVANPDLVKPMVFTIRDPNFPETPSVRDKALPDREKWVNYIEGWGDVMYMSLAPPVMPDDRAMFLENALQRSWSDPGFQKGLEKVKVSAAPEFITAKKVKDFMKMLAALSPDEVSGMKHVITSKYKKKK